MLRTLRVLHKRPSIQALGVMIAEAENSPGPLPSAYIELARVTNETAGFALRIDTRDATAIQAKVSIGLSLQAAELAGKAILRALGVPYKKIRNNYQKHNIHQLLIDAQELVNSHPNKAVTLYGSILEWVPIIDGVEFEPSIGEYFAMHFGAGEAAYPRSYFYPDSEVFPGPHPIQAIYVMVQHIIECAAEVAEANPSCQ